KVLANFIVIMLLGCSFQSGAAQEATPDTARAFLTHGLYKEALAAYTALLQKNPSDGEARSGLVETLIETGDYSTAEKKAKEFLSSSVDARLRAHLAKIQFITGRYPEAAAEFDRARKEAKGALFLRTSLGRARALLSQGKEEEARPALQEFISYYNANQPKSAEELTLIAHALVHLEKFNDANELFIDAREADDTFIEAFTGQGELLNEKYNYEDAASLFQDALKINPNSADAHTGIAESLKLTSIEEPSAAVDRALAVNPNHTGALRLRAWLDLEADRPDLAMKSIERALNVNPNAVEIIAIQAAVAYLADKKTDLDAATRRALAVNPKAGKFFATLAHFAVNNRRYADAVEFGKRAVELSPNLWSARTELGIQLLRVGRIADGRAELERAFERDPFNLWAKNTLDLLDTLGEYPETIRGPFLLKISPDENAALSHYAADLLVEAHKKLAEKYRFTPRAPISVEMFEDHEDFAVRSLGLPGLGALGICFGQVIAMDSPSARPPGEFNWGSTLWHEYTHVVTLQITDYRIPRWFSEGLSVYEERRARRGWGDNWSIERLKAIREGRFVKIDDLDSAFIRPRSPDQVPLAYFQASLVCDFIDEKYGFDAILKMLSLYKEGAKTVDVFKRGLSMTTADFDKAFTSWLQEKASPMIESLTAVMSGQSSQPPSKEALQAIINSNPKDYFAHLRLAAIYKKEGDADQAITHLKRAIELFPYYGGEGNPYVMLADIYESRGQKAEAASSLEALTHYAETDVEAFKRLARLKMGLGDRQGAAQAIATSFYIYPFEADLHKLAGDVYLELGQAQEAVREFRVLVALNPPDLAGAHYDLARALDAAGDRKEAKREVLRSLEIAPGFEKAQELLLKLRGGS
ncbi:MAG: tetratricopeptide repeat protein, partial [Acidobacteriota bacterium]